MTKNIKAANQAIPSPPPVLQPSARKTAFSNSEKHLFYSVLVHIPPSTPLYQNHPHPSLPFPPSPKPLPLYLRSGVVCRIAVRARLLEPEGTGDRRTSAGGCALGNRVRSGHMEDKSGRRRQIFARLRAGLGGCCRAGEVRGAGVGVLSKNLNGGREVPRASSSSAKTSVLTKTSAVLANICCCRRCSYQCRRNPTQMQCSRGSVSTLLALTTVASVFLMKRPPRYLC